MRYKLVDKLKKTVLAAAVVVVSLITFGCGTNTTAVVDSLASTISPTTNSPATVSPVPTIAPTAISPVTIAPALTSSTTALPPNADDQISNSITSNSSDTPREKHPVVAMTIHFELLKEDLDMTSLYSDYDLKAHKSCFYMPKWPPEIEEAKVLYIPIGKSEEMEALSIYWSEQSIIYICPNATSLDEVNPQAPGTIFLMPGEIKNGMTAFPLSYEEYVYYIVEGIVSGGGGILISNDGITTPNDMQ